MPVYVLDSNFFIQAHRVYYPIDVAASFWNKVRSLAAAGKIISIDKVKDELYDKNDDLEAWCVANLPANFFKDTSSVMDEYGQVTEWAISKASHYLPNALKEFLDAAEADAFLVAYCLANEDTAILVTQEVSEPSRRNKVKIPDACNDLKVPYVSTIDMFRQLGETF